MVSEWERRSADVQESRRSATQLLGSGLTDANGFGRSLGLNGGRGLRRVQSNCSGFCAECPRTVGSVCAPAARPRPSPSACREGAAA